MEAVRRLRDVIVLSVFVLSIFALVGLQIYQGVLKQKCILNLPEHLENSSEVAQDEWYERRGTNIRVIAILDNLNTIIYVVLIII